MRDAFGDFALDSLGADDSDLFSGAAFNGKMVGVDVQLFEVGLAALGSWCTGIIFSIAVINLVAGHVDVDIHFVIG